MLKSLGLDMPAKAKEQNGQDAVGEFPPPKKAPFKKIFTSNSFHPKPFDFFQAGLVKTSAPKHDR